MKAYIKPDANFSAPIRYVLKTIARNHRLSLEFVDSADVADRVWDPSHPDSQVISTAFYDLLKNDLSGLEHRKLFPEKPVVTDAQGREDHVATIFYLLNCLQEFSYQPDDLDRFGRFRFESSLQHRFGNIGENLVQQHMDALLDDWKLKANRRKSRFFISHDIDSIYGSFLQDGFWAIKKLRIGVILKLIANELLRKPHWKNMDQIIRINSEYELRSTFFWLVNKGKGLADIKNADYDLRKEQALLRLVKDSGFVNGLHKSSSPMSLNDELERGRLDSTFNRYHFLNFLPSKDWKTISDSKIDFDCSLGFAEAYGFRNSYGGTFQPFDIESGRPFDFVEAPLNFMDGTFHKYMRLPQKDIADIIIDFYEKNSEDCLFSLLWHNTYFTDYKYGGFLEQYKKVMGYLYENKIEAVTPDQIIAETKLTW